MYYWQEDNPQPTIPDTLLDVVYKIECRHLPLDHAYALSSAIQQALPWLQDIPQAGIHLIHGAESGNGWMRPQDATDQPLHLSRRTRMTLRLPTRCVTEAQQLTGKVLDIGGYPLTVGPATIKPLIASSTLFSRYVITDTEDEMALMGMIAQQLQLMGITPRKLLCGKPHSLQTPTQALLTRSVMIADLTPIESISLQHQGIGEGRKLGCGLFIPHKGISAVNATEQLH